MKDNFSDDNILVSALVEGNPRAFKFLMNNYHRKLCAYAFSLCHSEDQAEDIVQNVFLKLWKNRHKLNNIKKLSSFLFRSVYNEFIDQYRQSKEVIKLEKKHIDLLSCILEEETDTNLDKLVKLVEKEIDNLPTKYKKTFLMSKKEGLTNFEIAEYLNISVKSVERHITKAFKLIRAKIAK